MALVDEDATFSVKAKKIAESNIPLILVSSDFDNMKSALELIKDSKPLVYLETEETNDIISLEKEYKVPVVVFGDSINTLVKKSFQIIQSKAENLVLSLQSPLSSKGFIEDLVYIRRAAIENKFKPLGFPIITFLKDIGGISHNNIERTVWGSALMCKYSNIMVLDYFDEALIYSLLTLRQNIYTDPQKPLQIDPKIYPIGDVNENSPVIVTTNFALTYFTVTSEIEASSIPVYLLITPSDGMSVLTAWAASKFTGETIAKAVKEYNLENQLSHKRIIIPGLVASLKEEIEEELPGWEIVIGTNEAVDIPDFLNMYNQEFVSSCN